IAADRASLARGFQDAVLDVLVTKLERAVDATGRRVAVLGGGVACSRALAALAARRLAGRARVAVASPRLNADNAAMIARAGWWRLAQGEASRLNSSHVAISYAVFCLKKKTRPLYQPLAQEFDGPSL